MNNKDFATEISNRLGYSVKDATKLAADMVSLISENLQNGAQVTAPSFGTFEVKKKLERVVVNPATQQRMLVPPKLAVVFKPNSQLKEKHK